MSRTLGLVFSYTDNIYIYIQTNMSVLFILNYHTVTLVVIDNVTNLKDVILKVRKFTTSYKFSTSKAKTYLMRNKKP